MDSLTPSQRHYAMSRIRGKDTKPEKRIRSELFSMGFRFRKNDKKLPGRPDIVFPKYRAVVFVNGCFWHGHQSCRYYVVPKSNTDFWLNKINTNRDRDRKNIEKLSRNGWRVGILWECSLRGPYTKQKIQDKAGEIANWLQDDYENLITDF